MFDLCSVISPIGLGIFNQMVKKEGNSSFPIFLFVSEIIGHGTSHCFDFICRIGGKFVFHHYASVLRSFFPAVGGNPLFECLEKAGGGNCERKVKDLMLIPDQISMKNRE